MVANCKQLVQPNIAHGAALVSASCVWKQACKTIGLTCAGPQVMLFARTCAMPLPICPAPITPITWGKCPYSMLAIYIHWKIPANTEVTSPAVAVASSVVAARQKLRVCNGVLVIPGPAANPLQSHAPSHKQAPLVAGRYYCICPSSSDCSSCRSKQHTCSVGTKCKW
jgi:hypothetical protein